MLYLRKGVPLLIRPRQGLFGGGERARRAAKRSQKKMAKNFFGAWHGGGGLQGEKERRL